MEVLRDNSLPIVMLLATLGIVAGMILAGLSVYSNRQLAEHGAETVSLGGYALSGRRAIDDRGLRP